MRVVCLTDPRLHRYNKVAKAMCQGIHAMGDRCIISDIRAPQHGDVAVCWGWKHHHTYRRYRRFVYFDLGYWQRENYLRFSIGKWSPDIPNKDDRRFKQLGLEIKPWRTEGSKIVVAGSTAKACAEHGFGYQAWETDAVKRLQGMGKEIIYRPKPNDPMGSHIEGARLDQGPISEAIKDCWAWVTHHSNSAVDALLHGIPVHCETGAASHLSVPIETLSSPELREGREQFLHGVAWLQWTLDEMRTGEAWKFIRSML